MIFKHLSFSVLLTGVLLAVSAAQAATPVITTVATLGTAPAGVAFDGLGNAYVTESAAGKLVRVDLATGTPTDVVTGLNAPEGVTVDAMGNVLFTEYGGNCAKRWDPRTNAVTLIAGNGGLPPLTDGQRATGQPLDSPCGIAVDAVGNVYIASVNQHAVYRIQALTGLISTYAGIQGNGGWNGDGSPASGHTLQWPQGIALAADGSLLITDNGHQAIRKVTVDGAGVTTLTTVVGSLGFGPRAVAGAANGDVYILCKDTHWLGVSVGGGAPTTVAGTSGSSGDGGSGVDPTTCQLYGPMGIAYSQGVILIADTNNGKIRRIENRESLTVATASLPNAPYVAAPNGVPYRQDLVAKGGSGTSYTWALVWGPLPPGLALSTGGVISGTPTAAGTYSFTIAVTDSRGQSAERALAIKVAAPVVTPVAGTGTQGATGDGGAATSANLDGPNGLGWRPSGGFFLADGSAHAIRRVDGLGTIDRIAGTYYNPGGLGDNGPALSALLNAPQGLAVDATGNLYITDQSNNRIRRVAATTDQTITTIAGGAAGPLPGDGWPATGAYLNAPTHVALDRAGNLYIAETLGCRVRKVDVYTGAISTIVGDGTADWTGDTGLATSARVNQPGGLAVDPSGNLYIAEFGSHVIRRIDGWTGLISTVAGTGETSGSSGDQGAATACRLSGPIEVALDPFGNVIICDFGNTRVRRFRVGGNIDSVAGVADGFASVWGLSIDGSGKILVGDFGNHRVRSVSHGADAVITATTGTVAFASAASSTANEAAGNFAVTVTLTTTNGGILGSAKAVQVTSSGITATENTDYTAVSTTVTFPAGAGNGATQTVNVPILADTLVEGNETLVLTLSSPEAPLTLGAQTTHTVTITDDDKATLAFAVASSTVAENAGSKTIAVTLSLPGGPLATAVTVDVSVTGGTATGGGVDYTFASPTTVTFPVGSVNGATQTVTVTIANDALVEGDETINFSLSNPSAAAQLGLQTTHALTITDDDAATVAFAAASSATADESVGNHNVAVRLTLPGGPLASAVTVNVSDALTGTATSGTDYTALSAPVVVTFPVGSASGATQNVVIPILSDTLVEGNETLNLTLLGPSSNASLGAQTTHTVMITDDDAASVAFAAASSATANEAVGNFPVIVTLTTSGGTLAAAKTVQVASSDITATAGSDYTAVSTTIAFPAGAGNGATQTVNVPILADTLDEVNETFLLTLSIPQVPLTLGAQATHTVTITDDNAPPTIVSSPTATPNPVIAGQTVAFAVTGNDNDGDALTYSWEFQDGTTATGATATHAFKSVGTYAVSITISDGKGGTVSASVSVTVNDPATSGGGDSDGDGYSDQIELALGSNPKDAQDTPFGQAALTGANELGVSNLQVKLNATTLRNDKIVLAGSLPITENLQLVDRKVIVNIGGVIKAFALDAKRAHLLTEPLGNRAIRLRSVEVGGTECRGSLLLTFITRSGKIPAQQAGLCVKLTKGDFASAVADDGLTADAAKDTQATVPVTVIFNGVAFQKAVPVANTGRLWQSTKKK